MPYQLFDFQFINYINFSIIHDCSLKDAWLPAKLPEYRKEEHELISNVLHDVFGELRDVQFCISETYGK